MLDSLIMLTLAPLLIWQGRAVRQRTPRLPEAAGARRGTLGKGQQLRLLVLGDSSAAGVGVSQQEEALAGQLAAHLAVQYHVHWELLAETGISSGQLLNKLDAVLGQQFDCAVLAIGVNDVTVRTRDKQWLQHLQRLQERLVSSLQVQHVFISGIPPMQHFSALPWPLNAYLGRRARRLNALTERMASQCAGVTFMPMELDTQPQMLAADGFHPSQQAYKLWAEQLAQGIQSLGLKCSSSNS
ncbi:MAG TPA: SGNH/GDSL hydrolase family protein [Thiopseudomonas sp.]|nr:SGNH/GDSL hydrolase family protein [Thiopseudomonas sp.]